MTKVTNETTAVIKVKGLGIIAFNSDDQIFEEALLQAPGHKMVVRVIGPTSEIDTTEKTWFEEDISSTSGVKIEIYGGRDSTVPGYDLNMNGSIDRLNLNQNNHSDFGWIPDLSQELNGVDLVRREPPVVGRVGVVTLGIKNARFSAAMPGTADHRENPFFMKYEYNSDVPIPFGFMAPEYLAEIESNEVTINITGTVTRPPGTLPHVPGHPYEIGITNIDPDDTNTMNDLRYIYQFLMHPDAGKECSLEAWTRHTAVGMPPISGWDYCHGGKSGLNGIRQFYP